MHYGRRQLYSTIISSLQAFWPGLQSLAGNVEVAINSFDALQKIWHKYEALPDMYSLSSKGLFEVYGRDYPLRPEMIESAYCLYMATREPKYLEFGVKFFNALERKCKVACGYASIADLETGRLDDRMDSYFLAETLKYLYLLFDEVTYKEAIETARFTLTDPIYIGYSESPGPKINILSPWIHRS